MPEKAESRIQACLNMFNFTLKRPLNKSGYKGSSCWGAGEMSLTSIHEAAGSIPDLAQWVTDLALP